MFGKYASRILKQLEEEFKRMEGDFAGKASLPFTPTKLLTPRSSGQLATSSCSLEISIRERGWGSGVGPGIAGSFGWK